MKLIKSSYLIYVILVSAFIGFLDSAYLTILHYQHVIPPCTVTNGCETVLTSSFSTIWGIPIALLGAGFYVSIIGLSLALLTIKLNDKLKMINGKLLILDAVSGFIISIVLLYIQFAILNTYCQYCLISEATSLVIFLAAIALFKNKK